MTTAQGRLADAGKRPAMSSRPRRRPRFNSAYLFVAPSVILIAVFIAEPILQSGWMSLHDWTIGEATHRFVGLANYTALFHDTRFWNALRVTVVYTWSSRSGRCCSAWRSRPPAQDDVVFLAAASRYFFRSSRHWSSSASSGSFFSTRRSA